MMHAARLREFYQAIGIDRAAFPPDISEGESSVEYNLIKSRAEAVLARLTVEICGRLAEAFGPALTFVVSIGDTAPPLEVRHGQWPDDLPSAIAAAQRFSSVATLEISIAKDVLLGKLPQASRSYAARYFLFQQYLVQHLTAPLPDLERQLFRDDRPTIVIVSDSEVHYQGELLTIAGEDQWESIADTLPEPAPSLQERLRRYRQIAAEHLSWGGFRLERLTPLHFLCECRRADEPTLTRLLARHTSHLAMIFTANRSSRTDQGYEAFYASPDRTVLVHLRPGDVPIGDGSLLTRFATWPYDGSGGTDRLTILQHVIARELDSDSAGVNSAAFGDQLDQFLNDASWNHRTFVERQIDKHFEQLQKASDYVVEVAKKVTEAVDSVTKGLTEALLATLGVLIAALLAALAKPQEEGRIVGTTMVIYCGYLLFQVVYRLGSMWHSASLLRDESTARLDGLRMVLGKSNVEALSLPLRKRWRQFYCWFGLTILLYLLLAGAAMVWAPGFVRSAIPPTATPPVPVVATPTP